MTGLRLYPTTPEYRLLVNDERTVLVTVWPSGETTVATREDPGAVWGPPVVVKEET
jgi:hypothetical protein